MKTQEEIEKDIIITKVLAEIAEGMQKIKSGEMQAGERISIQTEGVTDDILLEVAAIMKQKSSETTE